METWKEIIKLINAWQHTKRVPGTSIQEDEDIFLATMDADFLLVKRTDVKEFLYLRNKSINFNPNKAANSQNLPEVVKLNFAVNILKKEVMIKKKSVIGNRPKFFKLNEIEGFDIDTELDFEFADYLHKKHFS